MAAAKEVSKGDVTLGGAIRRASFLLANTISTREKNKKIMTTASRLGFPANMNAYP